MLGVVVVLVAIVAFIRVECRASVLRLLGSRVLGRRGSVVVVRAGVVLVLGRRSHPTGAVARRHTVASATTRVDTMIDVSILLTNVVMK